MTVQIQNARAWIARACLLLVATALWFWPIKQPALRALTPSASAVQFSNVTKTVGIDFVHFKGNNGTSTILEEAGPGVCVADYDGDGYMDI